MVIDHITKKMKVSVRRACLVLGIGRSTYHYQPTTTPLESALTERIIELALQYGRYGYRRITALLRADGWCVNHKRVERIWRQEGLKVPARQPKRRRLWLNDGSIIRLRPQYSDHVWSYDFVMHYTSDHRKFRMLTIIDEYSRECLAIDVGRSLTRESVIERLTALFIQRGIPENIRSDNGSEFTAKAVRQWLKALGVTTLYITPGSPWENGYNESFNGKLSDEVLNVEIFDTLLEAQVLIERWRQVYNHVRPHSSLGYKPPAPEAVIPSPLKTMFYMQIKSNCPNFDSGSNIGGWSIYGIVNT
jgi:transposase InsO family protein